MASNTEKAKLKKNGKWIYWGITLLFCFGIFAGGAAMLAGVPANIEGLVHLGYPAYMAKILGTAKVLGVVAIVSGKSRTLKEWAYAGITFNLLGASASHAFTGDPAWKVIVPLVMVGLVLASYRLWKKASA